MTFQIYLLAIMINNMPFSRVIFTMERQFQKYIMGNGYIVMNNVSLTSEEHHKVATYVIEGIK